MSESDFPCAECDAYAAERDAERPKTNAWVGPVGTGFRPIAMTDGDGWTLPTAPTDQNLRELGFQPIGYVAADGYRFDGEDDLEVESMAGFSATFSIELTEWQRRLLSMAGVGKALAATDKHEAPRHGPPQSVSWRGRERAVKYK